MFNHADHYIETRNSLFCALSNSIQRSKLTQWLFFSSDGHHFEVACEREINIPIWRQFRDIQNGGKNESITYIYLTMPQARKTTMLGLIVCHLKG